MKGRLYRWFSEENRLDWHRVLPRFLRAINASVNRSTGMAPDQIDDRNAQQVWERVYGNAAAAVNANGSKKGHAPHQLLPVEARKRMLRVGDSVRIKQPLEVFDKGYFPRFSDHIYRIAEAHATRPETYILTNDYGERVQRRFYRPELVRIRRDAATTYRVERTWRSRRNADGTRSYLVSFFGYPRDREWIHERDFTGQIKAVQRKNDRE